MIVEFKRPARNDYDGDENPISQVLGYVRKVRRGLAVDRNGRGINVQPTLPFFCYIICDLTKKIKEMAEEASLIPTPDGQGYFGFNPQLNTYTEVISFDKMVSDAGKRNRIFFEKMNLPKG